MVRSFTIRYNGHPDFAHMTEDFRAALASSDTVAVIGVGNVALDCARILAKGKGLPHHVDSMRTETIFKYRKIYQICLASGGANKTVETRVEFR